MLKKFAIFLKLLIVGTAWSYIYFMLVRFLFLHVWKFDILMTEYWMTIVDFWKRGGTIYKLKDLLFFLSIMVTIIIWAYFLVKLLKFKFISIIIFPVALYNNRIAKKYGSNSSRIVFKNISSGKKDGLSFKEKVDLKMKVGEKEEAGQLEAEKIRSNINARIKNKK